MPIEPRRLHQTHYRCGALTAPAGEKLEAKGAFKVAKGTKGVATVTLAGKSAAIARFEVK